MPKRIEPSVDDLLADLVNEGWEESPDQSTESWFAMRPPADPQYPPVPTPNVDEQPDSELPTDVSQDDAQASPGLDGRPQRAMDVGILASLAAGRLTADQAASFAGISVAEVQASLAVALRQVPPEEIAKALGLQAAEQQLKSGAIYGAILADLMTDLAQGKLKPETKIELAKLLARVGRIEPKEDKGAGAGGGFVLNINLGAASEKPVIFDHD